MLSRVLRQHRLLLVILGTGLLLRLAWGLYQGPQLDPALPDQREYLELAENLLAGRGLVFHDPRFDADVRAYRAPGYPLFLAALGASPLPARIAQACLDASAALAAYLLARRWLAAPAASAAAALVAFNPFLIYFSGLILSETLFTSILAWGMALLTRPRRAMCGTVLLAMGVLVRPSAMLLPMILAAAMPLALPGRTRAARALTAGMLVMAVLFPWAARNRLVLGRWVWTTTNGGITLLDGFNPHATGASNQALLFAGDELQHLRLAGELQRDAYCAEKARRWIRSHPSSLPLLSAAKVLRTWSPVPLSRQFARPLYRLAAAVYAVPFFTLVVVALVRRHAGGGALFLVMPALYFTVVHVASVGSLRYRVPAEPPLAVLAAAAAAAVPRRDPGPGHA